MEMSNGYLGLWLHFVETLLQAISWVGLKELEEHLESVVDVWLVIQTYKQGMFIQFVTLIIFKLIIRK